MKRAATHLFPAEAFVLRITLVVTLINAAIIFARGTRVDFAAYGMLAALIAVLLAVGNFYKRSGRSENIGAMTIAAGLFIAFTAMMSLLNYQLTPNPNPLLDPLLFQIDARLGYHWLDILNWAARHPWLNELMRTAYTSTLPQIAVLVVVLGLTSRIGELHELLMTVVVAGTITVLFWGFFPSLGPSAFLTPSTESALAVQPLVDTAYGREILSLWKNGPDFLSPKELRGLIAFPSFHIVLALIATCYARHLRWLFGPFLVLNLFVLPAVLVHGGHHLADIPAGIAVFAIAMACTHLAVRRQQVAVATA